ncbi:hypothetical protein KNSL1_010782 [Colletotrichum chrysophilum]|nr:hypothetical protein KNSL1_010782 [Colletotrichum chrysophilum]
MAAAAYAKALVCRIQQARLDKEKTIAEVISLIENVNYNLLEIKARTRDSDALNRLSVIEGAAYDAHQNQHDPTCHPDTRTEILQDIMTWAKDDKDQRIYWLNGKAGTGKSTIARTIARAFDDIHLLGASFFFKRGEGARSKASLLLSTIARQLVRKNEKILPFVVEALDGKDNISSKTIEEQFRKLILDPLEEARWDSDNIPRSVLVLDALDECESEKDIEIVIYLLSQLVKSPVSRLKVFATSRPEMAIHYAFDPLGGHCQEIRLQEVTQQSVSHDLRVQSNFAWPGQETKDSKYWST